MVGLSIVVGDSVLKKELDEMLRTEGEFPAATKRQFIFV